MSDWIAAFPWWVMVFVPIGWLVFWLTRKPATPPWTPKDEDDADTLDRAGW